jgi:hypothetical protein
LLIVVLGACGGGGGGGDDEPIDAAPGNGDAAITADARDRADAAPLGAGVSTLAGWAYSGSEDGPRDVASFNNPVNVEIGPDGDIYVTDFDNSLVRRVTPDGHATTLVEQDDFVSPFGIVFADDGTLYVQTDGNDQGMRDRTTGTIWRVNTSTGAATVVVSDIGRPRGLAPLPDGRLVIVDINTHVIRLLDPDATTPTPIPLAGAMDQSGDTDAVGSTARFNQPYGVAITAGGDILVADQLNNKIRRVTLGGVVTTFAGNGQAGTRDGDALTAKFDSPQDIAIDDLGNVYVSDSGNYTIRKIDTTGQVTTVAGAGMAGYFDGDALDAEFYGMEGISVTADGSYLYIGDGNRGDGGPYHRVRRVNLFMTMEEPDAGVPDASVPDATPPVPDATPPVPDATPPVPDGSPPVPDAAPLDAGV